MHFSKAIMRVKPSKAAGYFGQARNDIVDFSIGEPKDSPPDSVISAYKNALDDASNRYAPVQGLPALRERIAEKLLSQNRVSASPDEIIVTGGASEAIAFSVMSLVGRGDEAIIVEPSYPIIAPMVEFCGGKPVPFILSKDNGFCPDLEALKGLVSKKTKLLTINTPHNPTGAVFGKSDLKAISEIFPGAILSDEVYENFTYGAEHHSFASVSEAPENVITVNSFSKTYCMCGYRVGYLHARRDIISHMMNLKLCISTCTNNPAQKAALAAIEDTAFPKEIKCRFEERKNLMAGGLKGLGLPFVEPKGAFYVFPEVSALGGDEKAFNAFLDAGVLAMPGSVFHESCTNNVRFSFVASAEEIKKGIERLKTGHQ